MPSAEVFQEILGLHSRPMYIDNILEWPKHRAVQFSGDSDERTQLRNFLQEAKTRFWNTGRNTWWRSAIP